MWETEYGFEARAAQYAERVWAALKNILAAKEAEGDQAVEQAIAVAAPELQPHVASGYDTILRMKVKDDVRKRLQKHEREQRKLISGAQANERRL